MRRRKASTRRRFHALHRQSSRCRHRCQFNSHDFIYGFIALASNCLQLTLVHDIFTVHGKVQRISKSWKVCTMFSSSENKDTQSLSFSMALQASPSSQRSRLILLGENQNHIMLFLHIAESVRGRCPRPPLCKIPNM